MARTHGLSRTGVYGTWRAMKDRCERKKCSSYKNYGGRGIVICERWKVFENFFADMGHRPAGMGLDRINNDGNYEPSNCRWATISEQARNKRTSSKVLINGETKTVQHCAEEYGIKPKTLKARLKYGWDHHAALNTPVKRHAIEIDGITKTLTEWCKIYGVRSNTTIYRLSKGMRPIDALTKPSFKGKRPCSLSSR